MRDLINLIYEKYHEDGEYRGVVEKYHEDTESTLILTMYDEEKVRREVEKFRHHICGKTVVEIGAGIGLLALEMAKYAKYVVAIEKDPAWSFVFVKQLYKAGRKNLLFVFGDVDEFLKLFPEFRADVVVIYTRSGYEFFISRALCFLPKLIILNGRVMSGSEAGK